MRSRVISRERRDIFDDERERKTRERIESLHHSPSIYIYIFIYRESIYIILSSIYMRSRAPSFLLCFLYIYIYRVRDERTSMSTSSLLLLYIESSSSSYRVNFRERDIEQSITFLHFTRDHFSLIYVLIERWSSFSFHFFTFSLQTWVQWERDYHYHLRGERERAGAHHFSFPRQRATLHHFQRERGRELHFWEKELTMRETSLHHHAWECRKKREYLLFSIRLRVIDYFTRQRERERVWEFLHYHERRGAVRDYHDERERGRELSWGSTWGL